MNKKHLTEAALFMSAEPLTIEQVRKLAGEESVGKALAILDALVTEFNARDSALELVKTTDGRYRMQVRGEYIDSVKQFAVTTDLPKSVLRTLAIVAFKQPIKQSIVVKMRGNKAYDHIEQLETENFIKRNKEGNTFILETTKKFVDYFGEPIKGTEFIPASRQSILGEAIAKAEEDEAAEEAKAAEKAVNEPVPAEETAAESPAVSEEAGPEPFPPKPAPEPDPFAPDPTEPAPEGEPDDE